MFIKIHFFTSEHFPDNLDAVSAEEVAMFHQDINVMDKRYQGKLYPAMMNDCCWFLKIEDNTVHRREKL